MRNVANGLLAYKYKPIGQLGAGSLGVVFLCEELDTGRRVAIKQLPAFSVEPQFLEDAKKELNILQYLQHRNTTAVYDSFTINEHFYIVMEYCNRGVLSQTALRQYFPNFFDNEVCKAQLLYSLVFQLLNAVDFVHKSKLIHRDIKPTNVLLQQQSGDLLAKLADFGSAAHFKSNRSSIVGTIEFHAPELLNKGKYDEKVDIWALGCTIYNFLFDEPPFKTPADARALKLGIQMESTLSERFLPIISTIKACLSLDPLERPSARELLSAYYSAWTKRIPRLLLRKSVSVAVFGDSFLPPRFCHQNYCFCCKECATFEPQHDIYVVCLTDRLTCGYLVDYVLSHGAEPFVVLHCDRKTQQRDIGELACDQAHFIVYSPTLNCITQQMCRTLLSLANYLESSRILRSKSVGK